MKTDPKIDPKTANGAPAKKRASPEEWGAAITKALARYERARFHGRLEVQLFDGKVVSTKVERSVVDPAALAEDEDPLV